MLFMCCCLLRDLFFVVFLASLLTWFSDALLCVLVYFLVQFETADPALPAASQAPLTLTAEAYHSPNQRYLYIDPPLPNHSLQVGQFANIKVYSATPSYVPVKALSFLVRK